MNVIAAATRESAPGPEQWFTGQVWMEELGALPGSAPVRVLRVTFAPTARTSWHTHPHGQVLHVLAGTARVQRDGGPVVELSTGDSVEFAPGERHWHGAAPTAVMSHLAVQAADESGETTYWEEHVSDADYGTEGR